MIEIIQKDAPMLRKKAKEVPLNEIKTKKIKQVLSDMKEVLSSQEDGVAIAAPQINIQLRIFVVSGKILLDDEGNPGEEKVFINPVITKLSKKKDDLDEGCLSVRYKYGIVRRSTNASVRALDANGKVFLHNATGLLAQVFQHETDHLEGVLFIDKARGLHEVNPEDLKDSI